MRFLSILFLSTVLFGCSYHVTATPLRVTTNDSFKAELAPSVNGFGQCVGFVLSIDNLSEQDIEIDWNKTAFIYHGQSNGGFMFNGVVYSQRTAAKSPDYVMSKSRFSKTIMPNVFVVPPNSFNGVNMGWVHKQIDDGQHGAMLVVSVGEKEIRTPLIYDIKTTAN